MPAEIKAKLELVTGDGGVPAAGVMPGKSSEETGLMKDLNVSFKSISRFLKRPGAMFGGGGGQGLLGLAGLAAFFSGYGAAALGDKIGRAFAEWTVDSIYNWMKNHKELLNKLDVYLEEDLADVKTYPVAQPWIRTGGEVGPYWDKIKAADELKKIQERLNKLMEGGLEFSEQQEAIQLQQAEAVYLQLLNSKDLTSEEETQLRMELLRLDYVNQLIDKTYERVEGEKKVTAELDKQAELVRYINERARRGGGALSGGRFGTYIDDEYYTGKINQGNLQGYFIGTRVVG